jgi:hypothetical protein
MFEGGTRASQRSSTGWGLSGTKLLLMVATVVAGLLIWRHIRARELQHDAYV